MVETPLYRRIVDHLLDLIQSRSLQPGDRLPSENDLVSQFGVSRVTVRRALGMLSELGLVERVQGRGSFVATGSHDFQGILESLAAESSTASSPRLIGFVLPDFASSFGLRMVYAIEQACHRSGDLLVLKRTLGSQTEEESALRALVAAGIDGLIVFPVHGEHYNAELLKLVLDRFPIVLVDRFLPGITAPAICTDNEAAARTLTEHVLERGPEVIAFASPPPEHTSTIEERLQGFDHALEAHRGIRGEYLHSLTSTLPSEFQRENIARDVERVKAFFTSKPDITAFVVSEYNLALVVTRALVELGKNVPEDVAVACFDGPDPAFAEPFFTHVRQDESAIGLKAFQTLQTVLEGTSFFNRVNVGHSLVLGRSTNLGKGQHNLTKEEYDRLSSMGSSEGIQPSGD